MELHYRNLTSRAHESLSLLHAESPLGCLVENSQHTSNVLAHHLDFGQLGCSAASNHGDTQVGELSLKVIQLLGEVRLCLGLFAKLVTLNLGHGFVESPM